MNKGSSQQTSNYDRDNVQLGADFANVIAVMKRRFRQLRRDHQART
jgi:hypothetical protein